MKKAAFLQNPKTILPLPPTAMEKGIKRDRNALENSRGHGETMMPLLHTETCGNPGKPPLLMLHGFMGRGAAFGPVIPFLRTIFIW
ncbi:MAG: hypothetical protein R2861_06340 [Desulfobacterales bacterium]